MTCTYTTGASDLALALDSTQDRGPYSARYAAGRRLVEAGVHDHGRAYLVACYVSGWTRVLLLAAADGVRADGGPWCVWHAVSQVKGRLESCPWALCRKAKGGAS